MKKFNDWRDSVPSDEMETETETDNKQDTFGLKGLWLLMTESIAKIDRQLEVSND